MIDPNTAITIRVGELPSQPFNLTDNIPHEVGNELKRGTVQQLSDLIASVINVSGGVGFRAVTVLDGQTLPSTTEQEFILVGKGTYYNVSGGETLVLTEELNAIVSNGSFWFIGVEIPVNVELAGITQEIRQGFLNTTPSENAVFNALQGINTGLSAKISGTGTTNFVQKSTGSGTVGNSQIFDNGTRIGLGTNTPSSKINFNLADGLFGSGEEFSITTPDTYLAIGGLFDYNYIQSGRSKPIRVNTFGNAVFFGDKVVMNTTTDNGQGNLQVNGNITATPATLSNQVVVKSQLDLKANLASPNFTGTLSAQAGNFSGALQASSLAVSGGTASQFLKANGTIDSNSYAPTVSPTLTGTPTAPTATAGTNTTQIATTAFVLANTQSIPHLEFNNTDKTVWNNGKGNLQFNTGFGENAISSITTGDANTAIGKSSANRLTSGIDNTAIGCNSLSENILGSGNTSIGSSAGNLGGHTNINNSVFLGVNSRALGNNGTNEIVIGESATGAGSNTVTLGNTSITKTVLRGTVEASKLKLATTAGSQSVGNANMVSGTVTITTTAATTNSVIMLTRNSVGITGFLTYTTANGSFTINSNVIGDAGVISYVIFN